MQRVAAILSASLIAVSAGLIAPALGPTAPSAGATTPTTVTQTFGFDSDTLQNFTVPADVTSLTITATRRPGWMGWRRLLRQSAGRWLPGTRCPAPSR